MWTLPSSADDRSGTLRSNGTGSANTGLAVDGAPDSIALIARAIAVGRELVRVCDAMDQPVAGNHIALGLDLLVAHHDLATELALGDLR